MKLKINEIFYSLQGEGLRAGEPSIFIRLQGCSAKNSCFKSGVICDTNFEDGTDWDLDVIKSFIKKYNCKWIVWTGGEPLDQLTEKIIDFFKPYKQAIETSGIHKPPNNLDWIVLSPKINENLILKKFIPRNKDDFHCDELRWVRKYLDEIPITKIKAKKYYISPHFDKETINDKNLKWCIDLCLNNPKWSLSIQQHKIWKIR
tara:strand:+ start:508 stop:1116 length:609 start_codon:yes stop_codon:yes gene_type:complete